MSETKTTTESASPNEITKYVRFENVPLLVTAGATAAYALGLLIENIYFASWSIAPPELVRSEYIMIGLWACVFCGVGFICARGLSAAWRAYKRSHKVTSDVSGPFSLAFLPLSAIFMFVLINIDVALLVKLRTLVGVLVIGVLAALITYAASDIITFDGHSSRNVVITRQAVGVFVLILFMIAAWGYARWVYPYLPAVFGGKYRSLQSIRADDATTTELAAHGFRIEHRKAGSIDVKLVGPVRVIAENDTFLYVCKVRQPSLANMSVGRRIWFEIFSLFNSPPPPVRIRQASVNIIGSAN